MYGFPRRTQRQRASRTNPPPAVDLAAHGAALWWRAADILTRGPIDSWTDRLIGASFQGSGTRNRAIVGPSQWRGYTGVHMGVASFLCTGYTPANGTMTLVMVMRPTTTAHVQAEHYVFGWGPAASYNYNATVLGIKNTSGALIAHVGNANSISSAGVLSFTSPSVLVLRQNNAVGNMHIFVNGISVFSWGLWTNAPPARLVLNDWVAQSGYTGANVYYELAYIPTALSDADILGLSQRLRAQYGL